MEQLVAGGLTFNSTDFLRQAVQLIIECRRVLRWTYVHAFAVQDDTERQLFEFRQGKLEQMTEQLSKLTEEGVEQLQAKRATVLHQTAALRSYLDGMENDQTKNRVTQKEEGKGSATGEAKGTAEEEGKAAAKRKAGGKAGKAGKGRPSKEEQDEWTTDAQGTIVRSRVQKKDQTAEGERATTAANAAAITGLDDDDLSDPPARQMADHADNDDEAAEKEDVDEEEEEVEEDAEGGAGAGEAVDEEERDEDDEDEAHQKALSADIELRPLKMEDADAASLRSAAVSGAVGSAVEAAAVSSSVMVVANVGGGSYLLDLTT